jgi:four helix bundle protein
MIVGGEDLLTVIAWDGMSISRFEELIVWQKASLFAQDVYRITGAGDLRKDFGLRDQMQRAAVSVMSNIAEGFERYNRREFRYFLSIARGSAAEARSQLYLARSLGYIDDEEFDQLLTRCVEITRMLTSLRRSLG